MKKSALVMGFDNSVIARESILLLINEGYYVVAGYEGDSINREKFVEDNGISSEIEFAQINYSSGETVNTFISQVSNRKYTAIVNCYATLAETADKGLRHEFFDFDYVEFSRVMNANVAAIAAIVIGLKDNIVENGCIVNVTSSAAFEGAFATISYNASKAAIENLSKSLANNLGPYRNIRVNCVAPGWIPQSESVVEGNIVELANKCTPISQYGKAKDVAKAVLSLIDNEYANETTDKEYEKLDLIIEYEKEYIQCCRFYENSEKLNANRVAEDLIAKYKELGSKEPYTEYADTDPMKNFIRMRLSDVYFYKNMTCDKEQFNLQEMKESVELYETVIDNPSKIEFWDEKVDAYFCNSQGYTLRTMSKHEENEKKKLDYQNSALNKLSVAVSKQPNNGRYNRNLGLVYEDKGDLEKACERYKKAVQIDSFDYKAYNTVVSVELKRLEEEYGIKGRKEKLLNEIDFSNPKDWIEKIDNDILQCQKAEKLMFTFVDTHYNMAKAYMYKYLLEGKVKKELLKAAHNQIDIALELDPKSAGALYTKRNIYEAEGNYAEAKNCAENEVIAGKGDNKYLPSEYDKRMRMKLIAGK